MGSCISYHNHLPNHLPNDFMHIVLDNKKRCIMCMKPLVKSAVKCKKCNNTLGHLKCFQLWHSIQNKCPVCK